MPRGKSDLVQILDAVLIILIIFGMLYMFTEMMTGIVIIVFCGVLIFIRAFVKKHSW